MRRLAALAVICWSAQAYAEDATVTGIVEDALMHPLEGATVVIHDPSGDTVAKATTGKDGKFSFGGVPLEIRLAAWVVRITARRRSAVHHS